MKKLLLIALLIVGCCPTGGCGIMSPSECNPLTNCCDGIDNDCDGLIDDSDTGSCSENGEGEVLLPNCCDEIDNDEDGLIDYDDPDCGEDGSGESEIPPPPCLINCCDGIDNDEDGLTDGDDPDCGEDGPGELGCKGAPLP